MNWPAYPEYKASGESLGSIPSNWSVQKLSWLFGEISSGTTPESKNSEYYDGDFNWVTTGELREEPITETTQKVTQAALRDYSALKIHPPGSLLIAMYGATIGRLGWLEEPACTNQACCVFSNPQHIDMRYAFYSLRAARSYLVFLASGGGQPNISQDKLRGLRIAVPPLTDQQTISKFLDNETAKLDALIGKQEQLITTLREDRTATIVHAVTKGLNPNVEMKDSGVSWIGQVPAHWTVGKVKHGFAVTLGKMYQGQAENAEDIELPHLKAGSVTSSGLDTQNPMMCWFSPHEIRSLSLRKGDVLVVEGGAIGRCVVLDRDMTGWGFQKSLNRVRALSDDSPRFLAYVIETATESGHVSVLCGKSTIPHFTAEKLEALEWPHPSVEEQRQVVQFLDQRCAKIDALIAKATEVIETMREYRSALITSAVTGKIDVRGAA